MPTVNVAIYCRVSDPDDPRETSFELQEGTCREYAAKQGWAVVSVFRDRYTGTELYDRPQLSQVREGIRDKRFQVALVWKLDRLSRKTAHLSILFEEAERHGCRFDSATEDVENTPEGELLRNIRGYVSEIERIKIIERTQGAVRHILKSGKPIGSGLARFGYRYGEDNRTREIVEEHAAIVRRIFQMALDGQSFRKIAAALNAEGVPSPSQLRGRTYKDGRNCKWTKTSLHEIVTDPSYYGHPMAWGKTKATAQRVKETGRSVVAKVKKEDWTTLADPTPEIVSKELWDRANGFVVGRDKRKATRTPGKKFRMLRGFVCCGICGKTMTTQSVAKWGGKGRYEFYLCMSSSPDDLKGEAKRCGNGRTQVHHADSEVWRQVSEFLRDKEAIRAKITAATTPEPDLDKHLEVHQEAIRKSEQAIQRLVDRLADEDDETVLGAMRTRIDACKREIAGHKQAIVEVEERMGARAYREALIKAFTLIADYDPEFGPPTRPEELPEWFNPDLHESFFAWLRDRNEPTPEQKREILLALGARVELQKEKVVVTIEMPVAEGPSSAAGGRTIHQCRIRL